MIQACAFHWQETRSDLRGGNTSGAELIRLHANGAETLVVKAEWDDIDILGNDVRVTKEVVVELTPRESGKQRAPHTDPRAGVLRFADEPLIVPRRWLACDSTGAFLAEKLKAAWEMITCDPVRAQDTIVPPRVTSATTSPPRTDFLSSAPDSEISEATPVFVPDFAASNPRNWTENS